MLPLFVRWCRDDLRIDFVRADDLVEEKSKAAFRDTFLPAWNGGRLSKRFYNDGRIFMHGGAEYLQYWDENEGAFRYRQEETGEILGDNPAVLELLKPTIVKAFKRVDADGSGSIDRKEFRAAAAELTVPLQETELNRACKCFALHLFAALLALLPACSARPSQPSPSSLLFSSLLFSSPLFSSLLFSSLLSSPRSKPMSTPSRLTHAHT